MMYPREMMFDALSNPVSALGHLRLRRQRLAEALGNPKAPPVLIRSRRDEYLKARKAALGW